MVLIRIFSLVLLSSSITNLIEFCLIEISIILIFFGIYYEINILRDLILNKAIKIETDENILDNKVTFED